jgi:hypothetical protein
LLAIRTGEILQVVSNLIANALDARQLIAEPDLPMTNGVVVGDFPSPIAFFWRYVAD